ncbi:ATP-binding protein [Candidatus Woesearchaeota archaeon]|nr:ATP-binding protein [Candidatus Woesearchaeota archaeon]
MYEIIIGRNETDRRRFRDRGTFLLGKHYVKMGQATSLSTSIYMDAVRPHVVLVVGKRGSGKSYTASAIAEGMMTMDQEISGNLSVILLDTMGIFWTMKYENKEDAELLKQWGIPFRPINVQVYTPVGYYAAFKEKGISDFPFSIRTSELSMNDWLMTFGLGISDPAGILIARVISGLQDSGIDYSIRDILLKISEDSKTEQHIKNAAENLFLNAERWGLFSETGTKFSELVAGGQVTVLDVSCYSSLSGAENLRSLVIGLVSKKLFEERMAIRRFEEYSSIKAKMTIEEEKSEKLKVPMIWIAVDEAHEFLPKSGRTAATDALITLLREGRQPGISLILATQQPGQIHTDVMTQADIIIAHRLTAKIDIDSLGLLMQTYMRESVDKLLAELPDVRGAALVFDDTNERIYPAQIRPKMTWHGGASPTAMKEKEELFELKL